MPDIDIKRGYEVLPDNNVRFGIRITNNTDYAISDVEIILDYTESLFDLEGDKVQKLGNIPPTIPRTAKYILKPLGCVHKENIEATIMYRDHKWEKHVVTMRPKEVHCVCPFLKEIAMTQNEFCDLSKAGHSAEAGLNFQGVSIEQLTSFLSQICRNRLYKVDEYSIEGGKILYLAGESIGEKAYYLLTAYIKENEGLTQVMLRAVSDKPHGLNGFLNEIVDNLRHVVSTVQSAREIGVIKKEQVINIIDSVVQRTTFAGGEGAASVNIEGSVVQRTEIKGDEEKKISEEERLRKEREREREREKQERIAREREELKPQKEEERSSLKKFFAVALVLGVLLLGYWVLAPGATDGPETLESTPTPKPTVTAQPTPTDTIVLTAKFNEPSISLTKEVDKSNVEVGERIRVTIKAKNTGSDTAKRINIDSGITPGFTFKNIIYNTYPTELAEGNTYTQMYIYEIQAEASGTFTLNTAKAIYYSSSLYDERYTTTSNNPTITVTEEPVETSDFELRITQDKTKLVRDEKITFAVYVKNLKDVPATFIRIEPVIPNTLL